jgi:hypothetical protein
MIAYAQTLDSILNTVTSSILNPFIKLLFAVATLVFIWGIIQLIASPENSEARENGKRHIIWGLVGATIMLGTFGIINLILTIFQ